MKLTKINNLVQKNKANNTKLNQKNPQEAKKVRTGINMTEEQIKIAKEIKDDILKLYNEEGYSIRMISAHYNDIYSIRDKRGNILKEAISRETVRNIINGKDISLKTIIGLIKYEN